MPRKAAAKKKPVIKKTTPTARQSAIPTAKHLAASNAIPEYLQRLPDDLEAGGHYLGWEDDDWVIRAYCVRTLLQIQGMTP